MKAIILPVLLAVMQVVPPVPRGTAASTSQNSADSQKSGQQHQKSAPTPAHIDPLIQTKPAPDDSQEAASHDSHNSIELTRIPPVTIVRDKKGFWDYVFDWGPWVFSLFLVGVGGWQVWLLFRTLGAIKRQADTMERQETILADSVTVAKKAVEAAEISAKVAMGVTIPVLVLQDLKFEDHGGSYEGLFTYPVFRITVKNFGQSPAFLKSYAVSLSTDDLPSDPIHGEPWTCEMHEVIGADAIYVMEDGRCSPRNSPDAATVTALVNQKKFPVVYGYIAYGDIFGSPTHVMRFSKIFFEINPNGRNALAVDWGGPNYTGQQNPKGAN